MIVKRGNKFRVVSHTGKNLGESSSRAEAKHRLAEVEMFKKMDKYKKCIVHPDLIKEQKFQPIAFQSKDPAHPKKELDFPSTPLAYDLKDVAQPEFISAPAAGRALSESFSTAQGPDIQRKGSDYDTSGQTVIGKHAMVAPRNLIAPSLDQHQGHVNPPRQSGDVRIKDRLDAPNKPRSLAMAGQTIQRSLQVAGRKLVLRKQFDLTTYPVDRGTDPKTFNASEEADKRREFAQREKMKEKLSAHDRAVKEKKQGKAGTPFDPSTIDYLARAKKPNPLPSGESTVDYPGAKVTFNQPIDPTKKPKKVFTHLTPEGQKVQLQRKKKNIALSKAEDPKPKKTTEEIAGKLKESREKQEEKGIIKPASSSYTRVQKRAEPAHPGFGKWAEEENKRIKSPAPETGRMPLSSTRSQYFERSDRPNPIEGGKGDNLKPNDVDDSQLTAGINVEQEHVGKDDNKTETEKRNMAQDIALDHLAEDKEYYTKLAEMERGSKANKKEESKKNQILRAGVTGGVVKMHRVGKSVMLANYPFGTSTYIKVEKKKKEAKKSIVSMDEYKAKRGKTFPRPMSVINAEKERAAEVTTPKKNPLPALKPYTTEEMDELHTQFKRDNPND